VWAYEVKWDGVRALATVRDGALRLRSRPRAAGSTGNDVTPRYPELEEIGSVSAGGRPPGNGTYVIDGEVVMFDDAGRPSFPALQHRMHIADPNESRRLAAERSVVYVAFDVLWTPDGPCVDRTYDERRALLDELVFPGQRVLVPSAELGDPDDFVEFCRSRDLEGVVAKRRDSVYRPGRRTDNWVKTKFHREQEFVVVGWTEGTGGRSAHLGALLLAYHDAGGALVYCGKVGTGFNDRELRTLGAALAPLARPERVVDGVPTQKTAIHWVEPTMVVQVRFGEWSPTGHLRHPSYLGRRADKDAADVIREPR
jgi:bifunctional non-homologous end joining protein LigD